MLKYRRKQSDFVGCPPTSEGVSESLPSSAVFTTSPSLSAPKIGSCVEGPFVGAASLATLVELNDDLGSFWQPLGSSTGLSGTKEAWPTSQGISVSKGLEDWMEPLVMPPSDFNRDWIATVFSHSLGSIICRVSWLSVPYGNVSSTYVYPDDPHLQFDWGKAPHTIVYERIYLYVPSWRILEYIKKTTYWISNPIIQSQWKAQHIGLLPLQAQRKDPAQKPKTLAKRGGTALVRHRWMNRNIDGLNKQDIYHDIPL